jgi:hypothetical protein
MSDYEKYLKKDRYECSNCKNTWRSWELLQQKPKSKGSFLCPKCFCQISDKYIRGY